MKGHRRVDLLRVEEFVCRAVLGQRSHVLVQPLPAVETSGGREDVPPGLLLERAPQFQGLHRHTDVVRVWIREAEDARPAVTRATYVTEVELLEQRDAEPSRATESAP